MMLCQVLCCICENMVDKWMFLSYVMWKKGERDKRYGESL